MRRKWPGLFVWLEDVYYSYPSRKLWLKERGEEIAEKGVFKDVTCLVRHPTTISDPTGRAGDALASDFIAEVDYEVKAVEMVLARLETARPDLKKFIEECYFKGEAGRLGRQKKRRPQEICDACGIHVRTFDRWRKDVVRALGITMNKVNALDEKWPDNNGVNVA